MKRASLAILAIVVLGGCTTDTEARGREAVEKLRESIPDVEAKALAQQVGEAQVRSAQQALAAAKEYLGEVNGKLDSVTVNAIEAFQRKHGIEDDGMLNEKTTSRMSEVLAKRE